MEEMPSRTLFLLFEQYETPAVPYSSIFNGWKPYQYHVLIFPMEEMHSRTLFLLFEQDKTPAVP